ncbi:MAG: DUF445 domain-containing protein [Gammaproteobacteria bacterium]|nr:DUF445 domain-containing protein [Gammaproteobacteria bacterium]
MWITEKHVLPNVLAALVVVASFAFEEPVKAVILSIGLFALSGAITNWLAIHMLFDRVPGLYGSGVVPLHFEEFKTGLMSLVTTHLFKAENVEAAFTNSGDDGPNQTIDLTPALEGLDLDVAYDQLVDVIMESSFGAMLGMVGGAQALEPMRAPFKTRMHNFLAETASSKRFQKIMAGQIASMTTSEQFMEKITEIVQARLDELTPDMVKNIVQDMIRKHLGWLVVWGGVFGGVIGLLSALVFA